MRRAASEGRPKQNLLVPLNVSLPQHLHKAGLYYRCYEEFQAIQGLRLIMGVYSLFFLKYEGEVSRRDVTIVCDMNAYGNEMGNHYSQNVDFLMFILAMAPRVGFEPTTYRLTAGRSTAELSGNRRNV